MKKSKQRPRETLYSHLNGVYKEPSKGLVTGGQRSDVACSHTGLCLAKKGNSGDCSSLWETSQSQEDKFHMIPLTWAVRTFSVLDTEAANAAASCII